MAITELYSKRIKRENGEDLDVYVYYPIPDNFRAQVVHIMNEVIGKDKLTTAVHNRQVDKIYGNIHYKLLKEYGRFTLTNRKAGKEDLQAFFMTTNETDKVLDIVQLLFQSMNESVAGHHLYKNFVDVISSPEDGISELNKRFKEHGLGYQFENNILIRVDSTYIHSQVVKPSLLLLSNPQFEGAFDEYTKAHEHYRHSRNKECLADCLKAFESTMKIICSVKGWQFDPRDTASKLIRACSDNGLFQSFTDTQLGSLKNLLESGVPTIRNKFGGHGQGETINSVSDNLTRYCLNMTGTTIIFLIEQSEIK